GEGVGGGGGRGGGGGCAEEERGGERWGGGEGEELDNDNGWLDCFHGHRLVFARLQRRGDSTTRGLGGNFAAGRSPAKTSLASRVLPERLCELRGVEIGPQAVEKEQLRVGALPEQEVTQTPLAAGPDEQIDLGGHRIRMIYSGELPQILDTLIARRRAKTAACLRDAVSG